MASDGVGDALQSSSIWAHAENVGQVKPVWEMSMRCSIILFAAAVMMPVAVHAGDTGYTTPTTTPAAQTASQDQTSDWDKVICKKMPPPTGTRLGGRTVCQTKKRWLELEQGTHDAIEKTEAGCSGPGCGL
ncbi:MAG: hypothetical protein KGJ28_02650 [Alphaproteobacteria bacterium]|nr:hypothetical protein [Alphaproteobacteria bacterium]